MVSWSAKRKLIYISGAILVFLFALALPTFFISYKAPSCSDGVKNQGELGVDCGGPCSVLCKSEALPLIIRWQRAFRVKEGIYNAVAYVENPNPDSGIARIPYIFKLYDTDNVLIYERRGETFVPPKKVFGIFESNLTVGNRVPARAFFEFLGSPLWRREYVSEPALAITNKSLSGEESVPRLQASLENRGLSPLHDIEVVAILYDEGGNSVASSRTIVDKVDKNSAAPLVFTWSEPFIFSIAKIELVYRLLH